ncbi:hypothetical protein [Streptacidiphilus jiangxiensis]|uniref:Uncharacterized protein n=1 Tax=Streptacidiphilus jiangxiensis TaxID=235985 RepID=A0A1H8BK42_STRJI|nr:hypothetical protein [Streptacidiphilus jiangxiensis]SEM82514.1 hypothetical protein SAMN05414137_1675 [Streptacidiphilus jiangxiensis]
MPSTAASTVLALIEADWDMPAQLQDPYWSMRRTASAGGDSTAVLVAVEDLVQLGSAPFAAELGIKLADARHAAAATSTSQWFITTPSTTPGVEGHRHAVGQAELRRRAFRIGAADAVVEPDGSLTIRHRGGTSTTYVPVTEADYEAFLDGNRCAMEAVAALGAKVEDLIAAAEAVPTASWAAARSGVKVHIGGSQVTIFWWSATYAEQLRQEQAETAPWSEDGGYRDQVAALLARSGIQTLNDAGSLQVVCP